MAGNPPEDRSSNRGMIMPGDAYTGASITYRHPETGHQRVEWSGSMAGQWHGENDPAHSMGANLGSTGDGYEPHRMTFTMPTENGMTTKETPLLAENRRQMANREYAKEQQ